MKSRIIYLLSTISFLAIFIGCTSNESSKRAKALNDDDLIGTWRLVRTIEIGHEDSTNRHDGEAKYYLKNINKTHFVWVEYDRKKNQLLGTGGGTYTLKDNIYTENIHFYYPPGSNELGQAIPFNASIDENGRWRHTGYAKLMEFNPETATNVMVDSSIIDEVWEPVEMPPQDDTNGQLVGTWELVNYMSPTDSTFSEYPPFYQILKVVTPTYFTWVHYNKEGDEIFGIGGGPYEVSGDQYTETIQFIYPQDLNAIGVNAEYSWKLENNVWNINGTVQNRQAPEGRIENWKRYEGADSGDDVASSK